MFKIALLSTAALVGVSTTFLSVDPDQAENVTLLDRITGPFTDNQQLNQILSQEMYLQYNANIFSRTDFDGDGTLNSDEYSTLQLVKAELASLNGHLTIEVNNESVTLNFDQDDNVTDTPFMGFSTAERIRIDAVSRQTFYIAAGQDGFMNEQEFQTLALERFLAADLNGNQILSGGELKAFAQRLLLKEANVDVA